MMIHRRRSFFFIEPKGCAKIRIKRVLLHNIPRSGFAKLPLRRGNDFPSLVSQFVELCIPPSKGADFHRKSGDVVNAGQRKTPRFRGVQFVICNFQSAILVMLSATFFFFGAFFVASAFSGATCFVLMHAGRWFNML